MDGWKKEKAGDGRYFVRGADGLRRPGIVVGGRRRWAAEVGGQTIGYYPTADAACRALILDSLRAAIDAETRANEWLPAGDEWTPRGPAVPRPFAGT